MELFGEHLLHKKPYYFSLYLVHQDKKFSVRVEAMERMALLFKKHCSDFWKVGKPLPKTAKKFSWIPRRLVASSILESDPSMTFLVERLLDSCILGTNYTIQERVRCLAGVFASFDDKSKAVLAKLAIVNKKRTQVHFPFSFCQRNAC